MTMEEQSAAIGAASQALRRVKRLGRIAEMTLGNGIVLKIKQVPPLLLSAVQEEVSRLPDPPVTYIEEKGREEPNPNDPTYLAECERIMAHGWLAVADVILATGVQIESVPDGYFLPENDEWLKSPAVAFGVRKGLKLDLDDSTARFLAWLQFYAFESTTDSIMVQRLVRELSGISEEEVQAALDSFRRHEEWSADNGGGVASGNHNGHQPNRAARRASPRNRGA